VLDQFGNDDIAVEFVPHRALLPRNVGH
jgi:hypothetical protein